MLQKILLITNFFIIVETYRRAQGAVRKVRLWLVFHPLSFVPTPHFSSCKDWSWQNVVTTGWTLFLSPLFSHIHCAYACVFQWLGVVWMWRVSLCHNWAPQGNLVLRVFSIICFHYLPVQSCECNTGFSVLYENAVLEVMTKTLKGNQSSSRARQLMLFSPVPTVPVERGDKRFRNWTWIRTTCKCIINHTMKLYLCTHQKMVRFTFICTLFSRGNVSKIYLRPKSYQ